MIERDDVDYVSVKVSAATAPHNPWAFDYAVAEVTESLMPLYELAASQADTPAGPPFINLDMEEYRDLDLTLAVFMRVLDTSQLRHLQAGIVLQAYLTDALGAMIRIQEWAARRVDAGGAPVKVRVVKGANLPMERFQLPKAWRLEALHRGGRHEGRRSALPARAGYLGGRAGDPGR